MVPCIATYVMLLNNVLDLNKKLFLSERVALPVLNPKSAIFSLTNISDNNYLSVNHLRVILK